VYILYTVCLFPFIMKKVYKLVCTLLLIYLVSELVAG